MYRGALVSGFLNIGDVVYAQTWKVLTLKNCIEPPQVKVAEHSLIGCGSLPFIGVLFKTRRRYQTTFSTDKIYL